MIISLFACNADGGEHTHVFDKKVAEEDYLKNAADCSAGARYYYSCECGEKGSETFEHGDVAPHKYEKRVLDKYLRTKATATDAATYYYACKCGDVSSSYFYYGSPISADQNPNNSQSSVTGAWVSCDKTVYGLTQGYGYVETDEVYHAVIFNVGNAFHAIATNGVHYKVEGTVFESGIGYVRCKEVTDDVDMITFINYPDDINMPDGGIKDIFKGLRLYNDITGNDASQVGLILSSNGYIYPKAINKKGNWVKIRFYGKDSEGRSYDGSKDYYCRIEDINIYEYDF